MKILMTFFLSMIICFIASVNTFSVTKKYENAIDENLDKLSNASKIKKNTLSEIEELDRKADEARIALDNANEMLENKNKELQTSSLQLYEAKTKTKEQSKVLRSRMRMIYERGNMTYFEAIISAKSFSELIKRVRYAKYIVDYDNKLLKDYTQNEEIIKRENDKIKTEQEDIIALKNEIIERKNETDKLLKEKKELINKLDNSIDTYKDRLRSLQKQEDSLRAYIISLKDNVRTPDSFCSNKIYAKDNGLLQYPVPAYRGSVYNDSYGYRSSPISGKGEFHTGLDLMGTLDCDIVSAEDGVVVFADWMSGYGKCVIIQHADGISTLYGHNNRLLCHVGQAVKRGQVIAGAGTTGYSTGVHCHFEVRIDGAHTNPTRYIEQG